MPTRNINLTERLDNLVAHRIKSGEYGNASEVVREALRLLEHRDREDALKLKALRKAVNVGIAELDRGEGTHLKNKEEIDTFMDAILTEVMATRKRNDAQDRKSRA